MADFNKNRTWEVYLHGVFKWVRTPALDQYGKWSAQCYLTPESLEEVRELQLKGLKNRLRKDDDGYNCTISCPPSKETKTGKTLTFPAPTVLMKDENGVPVPLTVPVGNGSKGIAKMEVYEHPVPNSTNKAVAWRWKSLLVENLVPFTPTTDFNEEEAKAVSGLADQKEQLF